MMLLTKELLETFKKVGIQEDKELHEVQVIAKFFHAYHHRTRYATEYDPETETFFWLVDGVAAEWWYFSLSDFKQTIYGIPFERDRYFRICTAKELLETISKERGGYM